MKHWHFLLISIIVKTIDVFMVDKIILREFFSGRHYCVFITDYIWQAINLLFQHGSSFVVSIKFQLSANRLWILHRMYAYQIRCTKSIALEWRLIDVWEDSLSSLRLTMTINQNFQLNKMCSNAKFSICILYVRLFWSVIFTLYLIVCVSLPLYIFSIKRKN